MFGSKGINLLLFLLVTLGIITKSFGFERPSDETVSVEMLEIDSVRSLALSNFNDYANALYCKLNDTSLNILAFKEALTGYHNLNEFEKIKRKNVLTVIDFSKPSNKKRLFIIDLCNQQVLFKSVVAHGVNSGRVYAEKFSNTNNSKQSSLGFYVTTTTYTGKYDLALRLDGMEHSNNKASSRGVVMHGAKYATYEFLESNGMLGRSYGCPAMPYENFHQVVDWIKEGSCLYIYYPSRSYKRYSKYLNLPNYLTEFVW